MAKKCGDIGDETDPRGCNLRVALTTTLFVDYFLD